MTNQILTLQEPLQQTFEQVSALNKYINVQWGSPTGAGWVGVEALFAPESNLLARMITSHQLRYGTTAPTIIGSILLQNYHWSLISSVLATYFVARRVPKLAVNRVKMFFTESGDGDGIAFADNAFTALPDDPAAGHSGATIVPTLDALRDHLRVELESHLQWVIDRIVEWTECRPAGLWLAVSDRCMSTVSWIMQMIDPDTSLAQIQAESEPLLRVKRSPLYNKKVDLVEVTHLNQSQIFLQRGSCCYWYKTEGGNYCSTCPRLSQAERTERWHHYLAKKQGEG
jgi:hypothetical protein